MSLEGNYDPDNIFAKIVRGDMPCVKVYEDANTLGFMDVFPQSSGHMLVIHKRSKARNLLDVNPDDLAHIMNSVQKLTRAAKATLNPDGIIITQYNGAPAGQTVFHLHVHIIPRYEGDLKPHASGNMADMDELQALATRIKAGF
ncbi:MAG: HIT family protein [Robiginitomaculum sp.]|nr:HIT family protein [Robiginitomaculum sp.]